MPPSPPRTTAELQAWITATPPYHNINHGNTPFPDVNDFTVNELSDAMMFALTRLSTVHVMLGTVLERTRDAQANEVLITAMELLRTHAPKSLIYWGIELGLNLQHTIHEQVFAAKFADDMRFQTTLVHIALTIKMLRRQVSRVEDVLLQSKRNMSKGGDEDDWFGGESGKVRGKENKEEEVEVEQQRLFEAIEEHLRTLSGEK